ncbi:MAG: hypothetical protein HYV63_11085 [Candidatus Schekmanbacteria bacterium]|nr:hypothetical protein [Candidatus Schekmanbacteria bacterium]
MPLSVGAAVEAEVAAERAQLALDPVGQPAPAPPAAAAVAPTARKVAAIFSFLSPRTWPPSLLFLMLGLGAYAAYENTGNLDPSGDVLPVVYTSASGAFHGDFDLDEYAADMDRAFAGRQKYFLRTSGEHLYSLFPVGPSVMMMPFHLYNAWRGGRHDAPRYFRLGKRCAAMLCAFSVVALMRAAAPFVGTLWALLLGLGYAFGTTTLSISSQSLWQHGPAQFFVATGLGLLLLRARDGKSPPGSDVLTGLALGCAVMMRTQNLLLVSPLLVAGLIGSDVWRAGRVLLGFFMPIAAVVGYHLHTFGDPLGGYATTSDAFSWQHLWVGLPGLLVAPSRGLLVYSPLVLLALGALPALFGRSSSAGPSAQAIIPRRLLWACLLGFLGVLLLHASYSHWYGGYCYGPRYLSDALPALIVLLCEAIGRYGRRLAFRLGFVVLGAASVAVHVAGAFHNDGLWDSDPDLDTHQERLWDWRDSQIAYVMLAYRPPVPLPKFPHRYLLGASGVIDPAADVRHFVSGFYPPEADGRWLGRVPGDIVFYWGKGSRGRLENADGSARTDFPLLPACPGTPALLAHVPPGTPHLVLRGRPAYLGETEAVALEVTLGGTRVGTVRFAAGQKEWCQAALPIPPSALREGLNRLVLKMSRSQQKSERDGRHLGFFLGGLRVSLSR